MRYEEKKQERAALPRSYVGYKAKTKTMAWLSLQRELKQQSIPMYLYVDSTAIEDAARPECCWHIIRVAPCLQMKLKQMPRSRITSGGSID